MDKGVERPMGEMDMERLPGSKQMMEKLKIMVKDE